MNTHAPEQGKTLLDADGLARTLSRIAHEIIEGNPALDDLALVGIQTRGVPLARRLARLIEERAGVEPALGAVDITLDRDDVTLRGGEAPLAAPPLVRASQLHFPLAGRTVILVDAGDGVLATITVFETEEEAVASTEAAAGWVRATLPELASLPPQVTAGETTGVMGEVPA